MQRAGDSARGVARRAVTEVLQAVPILLVGFAASLALTPLTRQLALRLGVIDRPEQRKLHLDSKPMMGGLAIYLALALALLLFSPARHVAALLAVLAGAALLALLGLLDDRYDLTWRRKAPVMLLAAAGIVASGVKVALVGVDWIDVPLTILWIFVITNAVNYLDNMDGQSAGATAIAAFFFLVIAWLQELSLVSLLAAAVLGSALGFLVYNFNPSSSFMGDMGALPLGFILAVLAIKLQFDQAFSLRWFIPLFVLALPVLDVNLVTWTRLLERRSPAEAGKDHCSHRLLGLGLGQRQVLALTFAGCLLFGLLATLLSEAPDAQQPQLVAVGLLLMLLIAAFLARLRRRQRVTAG